MRSIPLTAVSTLIVLGAWACGGDDGGTGSNGDPVANFTVAACTAGTPCAFTDASTDPDGNSTITSRLWTFDDPTSGTANQSDEVNPTHTFAAAGTYTVTLTVTDNTNKTNVKSTDVTVNAATGGNQPPVASFVPPTDCVAGTPCGFHSTSTDPDAGGDITLAQWEFGDGEATDGEDVTHTFQAAGSYDVTLTVTDNGTPGATNSVTQAVTVTAATVGQDCTTSTTGGATPSRVVDCNITMPSTQASTVTLTIVSENCDFSGNKLTIQGPVPQTAFFNLCNRTPGETYTVKDASGTGAALVLQPGEVLQVRFTQGAPISQPAPPVGDPGVQLQQTGTTWTLNIDDGGNSTQEGEPDFDDAVVTLVAAPQ
jgi:PKD repeat protein